MNLKPNLKQFLTHQFEFGFVSRVSLNVVGSDRSLRFGLVCFETNAKQLGVVKFALQIGME